MTSDQPTADQVVEIRKYPNRRYYESGRSRHLTLDEIRSLIRNGRDVRVTDSATGADITPKVLTQIILELDSPKLELFPAPLLTQVIRVNDHLVKGFFEKFFNQALTSFLEYQRHFEAQLREGRVLPALFPPILPWAGPMFNAPAAAAPTPSTPGSSPAAKPNESSVAGQLQTLQEQVAALERKLARGGRRSASGKRRTQLKTK